MDNSEIAFGSNLKQDDKEGVRFVTELVTMRNIGKEMDKKLKSVGICSAEELIETGSKQAYLRLKLKYSNLCLVHLYTLQGAIDDMEYNQLTDEVKRGLKRFHDGLK